MTKNIEKTMKAFKVDLKSSKNQSILSILSILKSSVHLSNNQAHQVNEVAEKIDKLIEYAQYSNGNIILNHSEIKKAFFNPFKPQLKNA